MMNRISKTISILCAGALLATPMVAQADTTPTPTVSQPTGCVSAETRFNDVNVFYTSHIDDITWLACTGITTGFEDGGFGGMRRIQRQDMAAFLHRFAILRGVKGADTFRPTAADWKRFKDVNKNTPHAEDVLWLASTGVTEGYPDGSFGVGKAIVRQDMAAFLHRFATLDGSTIPTNRTIEFTDVTDGTPHAEHIRWLASTGITTGYYNNVADIRWYGGTTPVYRQDMAAFIHRLEQGSGCVQVTPSYEKQVKVKDAWTETVTVPATYKTVTVVDVPEHDEPVWVDTKIVHHDAVYENVVIPAVTHEEPVYEKQKVVYHLFDDGYEVIGRAPTRDEVKEHHTFSTSYQWLDVQVGTKIITDMPEHIEKKLVSEAWDEEVAIDGYYDIIHHEAVTHDEQVIDIPEHNEQVQHPAEYKTETMQATRSACPVK